MKNKTKKILTIFIMAFIIASIATTFAIVSSATEPTPTVEIAGKNITFEESTALKFAISVENAGENEPKLLVWTEAQDDYSYNSAEAKEVAYIGSGEIAALGAGEYDQFKFPVFAKQMTDVFYFRAYVEVESVVYYSDVLEYSVLEYAYDRLINSEDANFKALLTATLDQGAAAQIYGEYNTSRLANGNWRQVKISGKTLANGNNGDIGLLGDTFELESSGLTSPVWSTSDPIVATVEDGTVKIVGEGSAVITATASGSTVSYPIVVSAPFEGVADNAICLDKTNVFLNIGANATVSAVSFASEAITWESSDTNIATVENGVITAVAKGVVTVTATSTSGAGATCTVSVGTVNMTWNNGYVNSSLIIKTPSNNGYVYSDVITIPTAGTVITFTDTYDNDPNANTNFATKSAYVFSVWKKDGETWIADTSAIHYKGDNTAIYEVVADVGRTYTYTTTKDNESIRITYREGTSYNKNAEFAEVTFTVPAN